MGLQKDTRKNILERVKSMEKGEIEDNNSSDDEEDEENGSELLNERQSKNN